MLEFTVEDMQRDTPRWFWWPSLREAWRDAKRRGHPGVRRERSEEGDGPSFSIPGSSDGEDDRRRNSDGGSGTGWWGGLTASLSSSSSGSSSSDSGSYDSGLSSGSDSGSSSSSSD